MDKNVIELFKKSLKASLSDSDNAFLESQVQKHPWFSMGWFMLAKAKPNTRAVMKAAAYASNRLLLKAYLEGNFELLGSGKELPKLREMPITKEKVPVLEKLVQEQPEILPEEKKATAHPLSKPDIDWGLNTKISIRASQYTGMEAKIAGEVQNSTYSLLKESKSAVESKTTAEIKPVVQAKPVVGQKPVDEEKQVEKPQKEQQSEKDSPNAKTPVKKESTSKKGTKKKKPTQETSLKKESVSLEFQPSEIEINQQPGLEEKTENLSEEKPESKTPETDYQIGSFSGFSFLDEEEINPEIGASKEPEISAEERVLEVSITEDELKKYFKTKPENLEESTETEDSGEKKNESIYILHSQKGQTSELIDKFLEEEPSLTKPENYRFKSQTPPVKEAGSFDDLVTETLATIYARQGNIKKAQEIYEKLGLLFPEKKAYFALQIENLKS